MIRARELDDPERDRDEQREDLDEQGAVEEQRDADHDDRDDDDADRTGQTEHRGGMIAEPEQDPVCGMEVDRGKAAAAGRMAVYRGQQYYFCSGECRKKCSTR